MVKNYLQLVPRYMSSNKKTTLSMAVSIVLSVVLLVSSGLLLSKYGSTRIEIAKSLYGKYHGGFLYIEEDNLGKLKKVKEIATVGTTLPFGEVQLGDKKMELKGADRASFNMYNVEAVKGHIPKNKNEVAIEEWIYEKLKNKPKIGQKFKLTYQYQDPSDEEIHSKQGEFVFCGILKSFQDSINFETGRAYTTLDTALSYTQKYHRLFEQWYTVKDGLNISKATENILAYVNKRKSNENAFGRYRPNQMLLAQLQVIRVIRYVIVFFDLIVAAAAVMVIYNVFSISMLNRKKHFALLRTIGITQKQMKVMLLFEAFLFSIVLIPLGIIIGTFSTELIIKAIGGAVFKGTILSELNFFNIMFPVFITLLSIIIAVYNPIKKVSKTSPIESLSFEVSKRAISRRNFAARQSIFDKIIGYTGRLVINNLKRYKKRFISTVAATGVGLALFVLTMYVVNFFNPTALLKDKVTADYVLSISSNITTNVGFNKDIPDKIKDIKGIKKVEGYKYTNMYFYGGENLLIPKALEECNRGKSPIGVDKHMGLYNVLTQVYGCSDAFFNSLREKYSGSVNSKDQVFVVQNLCNGDFTNFKSGDERYLAYNYLDNGRFYEIQKEIKIDKVIKKLPMRVYELDGYIAVFAPYKFLEEEFGIPGYQKIDITIDKNADRREIEAQLQNIALNQKYGKLTSYKDEVKKWKGYQLQIGTLLGSLVFVIVFMGIINIMNTMNMNIIIRKREFGMLRALGMTKKEMRQVMLKEACMYGLVSAIFGLTAGNLLVRLVYDLLKRSLNLKFYIDFKVMLLALIITVLLSMCSAILPLKRATSEDIVESIEAVE